MTKFLNADLDVTLGGVNPSDEKVSSQKAVKTYADTKTDVRFVDVASSTSTHVNELDINKLTQAEYEAIVTPSDTQLYLVTDESIDYNDLVNKPTIGNATLTIQKNGTTVQTFGANATSNVTANITVPTNPSDIGAVEANSPITPGTYTKISYDSKGLVTGGSNITLTDVTDITVTATEVNRLADITSNVQLQLNSKQPNITGAATTITNDDLAGNKVVVTNQNGKIAASVITATELNYLDGVSSNIQTQLNSKVDKTNNVLKIYGTDSSGSQTTISYSQSQNASYLVQRDSNAQVPVPEIPVADENAASKKYVDGGLALKANSADLATVATSGSYTDLSNTPIYKTINSENIVGTGDIPLQTQLSGTNGNVVIYTSTTGTLSELGFDNAPTQNSNKLVKSGPIWTELQKKISYTDIKNNLTSADTDKPLSAYQGKVLDEKITLAQQSTHDRGVVLNALTSQGQNYTITTATVNTAGTNYTVGDTLFLVSDMAIDAIINVTGVNSITGAITSVSLGQNGAFSTSPSTTAVEFIGGTGTGANFNLTISQVNNSTLASIANPQPNDFATVLEDEIHNDLRYVWKYADIDGDGTYEWVAGYPITNIERNFYNDPIQDGELATNAVTTVKIANNNVTDTKIADDAILERHISTGAIVDDHIASGADIEQSKIKNLVSDLANKVSRTATAYQLYGTAAANTETTLTYTTNDTASTIVQRDANKQINIALTPTANSHATSKKYVDDGLGGKVDKVNGSKRVYGTDSQGNQTTYDYDSFGKVDDVKVGTTSVVVNKIASLGTMAGESKDDYIMANSSITGATKTKITYDSKGLVTAGDDLIESDIPSLHLSKVTDVTATAAEVNVLDGITASTTELNYVDGVTSSIQTQLNNKQATITGAATTVTSSDLTASRVLISNSNGKIAASSSITTTELGYLDGVTSSIQTQLDNKVDKTNANSKIYGTSISGGTQTTLDYSAAVVNGAIVQRDISNGQIAVPQTPTSDDHAASKKYVDDKAAALTKVTFVEWS